MGDAEASNVGLGALVRRRRGRLLDAARLLATAAVIGAVAGMSTFVYVQQSFLPDVADPWWAIAFIVLAGGYAQFLVSELDRSFVVSILALVIGVGIHTFVWTLPLWLLGFHPITRDILLPSYLGRAVLSAILVLPLAFYAGYFAALLVDGYFLE